MHVRSSPLGAAAWMGLAIVSFAWMAVAARHLSARMSTFEILFFRSVVTLLVTLPVVAMAGPGSVSTRRLGLQIGRNVVHFAGQFFWIYAIAALPLALVTSLEFTSPLWAAILATTLLGEKVGPHRWIALALGLAGVLLILRPGSVPVSAATLAVLASALCYGASAVMVKLLTRTDTVWAIVFNMGLIQLPLGLIPALLAWVPPGWADAPWLFILGVAALTAHYGMASALRLADTTVVLPIDFLRLPCVALIGAVAYAEVPGLTTLAGAALIFGGNYYSVWREARLARGG
jgi:drug/metabolite transporter (DMT)-like permease